MWSALRPHLVGWGLDPWRVETASKDGIPDVNYTYGWIELKTIPAWPKRAATVVAIDHFTPEQRVWGIKRWRAGGLSWHLLRVGNGPDADWLLFDGETAGRYVGHVDKEKLFTLAHTAVKSPSHLNILAEVKIKW
ncbi:MAG: hypothetical protein JWN75_1219 [Candidatus Saccharibacteria bacterium]|nr:hypothetical protein [Candidatus Saccharibacteria bacterium]MDB5716416.1 hypothetical protein [Sphingomonadales bacterium]